MPDLKTELLELISQTKQNIIEAMSRGDNVVPFFHPRSVPVSQSGQEKPLEKSDVFGELVGQVQQCRQCSLAASRRNVVFGEGDPAAKLVFVGEAPGLDEDKSGRPFVGEAGKLLTKIIESIGLKREEVYICNVLKCRPPGNRNPSPEEIEACNPFLQKQLTLLKPRVICALGAFAGQTLLHTKDSIGKMRGKTYTYQGVPVVPTYHPAALLYHPQNKKYVWQDMKQIAMILKKNDLSK